MRHYLLEQFNGFGNVWDALDYEAVVAADFLEVTLLRMSADIVQDGIKEAALVENAALIADKLHLHEVLFEDEFFASQLPS